MSKDVSSILDMKTPYAFVVANIREHLEDFTQWLVLTRVKKPSTAQQYAMLVRTMLTKGDIRVDSQYANILIGFLPSTRSNRTTARNLWLEYLGVPADKILRGKQAIGSEAPYQVPLGGSLAAARRAKLFRMFDAVIAQYVDLEKSGMLLPDLTEEVQRIYQISLKNYETRIKLREVPQESPSDVDSVDDSFDVVEPVEETSTLEPEIIPQPIQRPRPPKAPSVEDLLDKLRAASLGPQMPNSLPNDPTDPDDACAPNLAFEEATEE